MENEQENEEVVLAEAAETPPEPISVEEGIEDLRKKLEEQKNALEAERMARERAEKEAWEARSDRKSTRLNSSHSQQSRMPSSA